MRRTGILIAAVFALATSVAGSALAATAVPRGTLTSIEYREFLAVQKAEKQKPTSSNPVTIARTECRALTQATRLTSTQHAECVASVIFIPRLFGFTTTLAHCEKMTVRATALHCLEEATGTLYRATHQFIVTDRASVKAARARGITGKCLDYLVFTRRQARSMNALAPVLDRFEQAMLAADPEALVQLAKRLTPDLVSVLKSFDVSGNVNVCRHQ